MKNVAVVGAGYWGKNLVRDFNELGVLHTINDNNSDTLRSFKDLYPEISCEGSLDTVLKDPSIEALAIATPAETHFEIAQKALLAGKHIFVEKPLALQVEEAKTLHLLSRRRNLRLMVGHILLYHPAIIRLKEIIGAGELGKINYIYSNRLNLGKFRKEENILLSFAPHDISVILYLLDEMPSRVAAQGGNYLNQDIADVTMSTLSFKSGVRGHVFVSWLHPNKEQRLVVVGDKKMAVFDDTLSEGKLKIHDKGVEWVNRQPVPRRNDAEIIPIETKEPLKEECIHFLESFEKGTEPKTDGVEGIRVLKVLNACQRSLENQGEIISLCENGYPESHFAHETAVIDRPCLIGKGTKIWHFSHIMSKAEIGEGCNIGQNVVIAPNVKIGNNVKIQNNVSVYEGVILEDDVFCGPSMVFTNVLNPRSHISRKNEFRTTLVKKGATIGANATIVCGHTIGEHAFIGAGAVVTKDAPAYALMLGSPARVSGWMCECGTRLDFQGDFSRCKVCGREYLKSNGTVTPTEERDLMHDMAYAAQG